MRNPEFKCEIISNIKTTDGCKELLEFKENDLFMAVEKEHRVFVIVCKTELYLPEEGSSGDATHCLAYCLNDGKVYSLPLTWIGYPVEFVKLNVNHKQF